MNIKVDYSLSAELSEKFNEIILTPGVDYADFSPGHARFNVEISLLLIEEDHLTFGYEVGFNDGEGIETGKISGSSRIDLEIRDGATEWRIWFRVSG